MLADEAVRPAPRVLRLPPATGPPIPLGVALTAAGILLIGSVAVGLYTAMVWKIISVVGPLLLLVLTITICVSRWLYNQRYHARRLAFVRQHPLTGIDPAHMALAAAWRNPNRSPPVDTVRAALAAHRLLDVPQALILCYGDVEVPAAGAFRFEPEVFSPTQVMWKQLIWLPPVLLFVAWWILHSSAWLPVVRITLNRVAIGFSYLLFAGIVTALVWMWRGVIRAHYFRFAPGMVQVFEYRFLRRRPVVRSYPVEAGSLFIVARLTSGLVLELARNTQVDTIPLYCTRDTRRTLERIWQALLSTAPTPPLSNEELVG
jgi:hypothetical protein